MKQDTVLEIKELTEKLIKNQVQECEWNDKLLQKMNREEWKKLWDERSKAIRGYYKDNEKYLKRLRELSHDPEYVDAMYESVRAMFLQGRHDQGAIAELADPVVEKLRSKGNDDERAIIISMIRDACTIDYLFRIAPNDKKELVEESVKWVISHKDRYTSYEDIRVRHNILHAQFNLITMYVGLNTKEGTEKAYQAYLDFMEFWNRPEVQAIDGNDPGLCAFMENNKLIIPLEILDSTGVGIKPEYKAALLKELEELCKKYDSDESNEIQTIRKMVEVVNAEFAGSITAQTAIERFETLIMELPETDWRDSDRLAASQATLLNFSYLTLHMTFSISRSTYSAKEKEDLMIRILRKFRSIIGNMPYEYQLTYIDAVFRAITENAIYNISHLDLAENVLYELLIRRQPSTFLHSQMVEEIAVRIAKEILIKEPALFTSLPEYESVEAVLANKEKLIEDIARGARLHDLGKSAVTTVIMRQSRRINDDEFACIKVHPTLGVDMLKNIPDCEQYKDIIKGHHKTYDGKGGYPSEFDNTASPYRILIDLVSISDSADAATDTTGRNYTAGKDFKKLLGELLDGAGSRYNPDIVRIIENSPKLIEDLTELTSKGRIDYCYEAYQNCLGDE